MTDKALAIWAGRPWSPAGHSLVIDEDVHEIVGHRIVRKDGVNGVTGTEPLSRAEPAPPTLEERVAVLEAKRSKKR